MDQGGLEKAVAATSAIYIASDRESLFEAVKECCCAESSDLLLLSCHKATRQELVMDSRCMAIPHSFLSKTRAACEAISPDAAEAAHRDAHASCGIPQIKRIRPTRVTDC